MRTYTAKASELEPRWYLIDAEGQTLGRLASNIARVLKGKHKPSYSPHLNGGDFVVVVNAGRVRVTGKKMTDKIYDRYTGYPGGLRSRTLAELLDKKPEEPLREAVRGMLQHNTLGDQMLKRLKIYPAREHRQAAQKPLPARFSVRGDLEVIGS
jgi:large subunit ribosomal protein L13